MCITISNSTENSACPWNYPRNIVAVFAFLGASRQRAESTRRSRALVPPWLEPAAKGERYLSKRRNARNYSINKYRGESHATRRPRKCGQDTGRVWDAATSAMSDSRTSTRRTRSKEPAFVIRGTRAIPIGACIKH